MSQIKPQRYLILEMVAVRWKIRFLRLANPDVPLALLQQRYWRNLIHRMKMSLPDNT